MLSSYQTRRIPCPLMPKRLPRSLRYACLCLLLCTIVMLCFYSYPLEVNSVSMKMASLESFELLESEYVFQRTDDSDTNSLDKQTLDSLIKKHISLEGKFESPKAKSIKDASSLSLESLIFPQPISHTTEASPNNFRLPFVIDTHPKINNPEKVAIYEKTREEFTTKLHPEIISPNVHESEAELDRSDNTASARHPKPRILDETIEVTDLQIESEINETNLNPFLKRMIDDVKGIDMFQEYDVESVPESLQTKEMTNTDYYSEMSSTEKSLQMIAFNGSSSEEKFLVHSENCKIPYIDPMHPSIRRFVKTFPPLSCQDEIPLTYTEGNTLFLNITEMENVNVEEFRCCYREFRQDLEVMNDNVVEFFDCHEFTEKAAIPYEFIQVKCTDQYDTDFYEEFYSFVHDKPEVERIRRQHDDSTYSVLIVGIDSMSRLNMHRQMKKTLRYLLDEMHAVEMFGYNKVGDNTFPNLIPLLVGYDERELPQVCYNLTDTEPLDNCNYLWKRYAEKGYRTLYAEDSPHMSTFNYVKEGFHRPPTDYYFRPFIALAEFSLGKYLDLNTYACVGSVSETQAVLSWVEKFAANFRDRPYFSFAWINSLTHDNLNKGSSVDHLYEGFLRNLHQSDAFNKTIVIVLGDHGMRWGAIRKTYVGRLEERLPALLIALPESFKNNFPKETKNLQTNAHRLITPFDLHATLVNLLRLKEDWIFSNPDGVGAELAHNYIKRATSLFQLVAKNRSCADASIDEHWCTCESSLPVNTDHSSVKKASKFLVKKLNYLLSSSAKDLCAKLRLHSVVDARVWSPNKERTDSPIEDTILTLIIKTKPGGAVFEATIRRSSTGVSKLLGSVSRLNLYGTQSYCVQDAVLKKYCFCL